MIIIRVKDVVFAFRHDFVESVFQPLEKEANDPVVRGLIQVGGEYFRGRHVTISTVQVISLQIQRAENAGDRFSLSHTTYSPILIKANGHQNLKQHTEFPAEEIKTKVRFGTDIMNV